MCVHVMYTCMYDLYVDLINKCASKLVVFIFANSPSASSEEKMFQYVTLLAFCLSGVHVCTQI